MTVTILPLSVVIPTIGRCELLRRCLRSVLACTRAADEVIVVDQSGAPNGIFTNSCPRSTNGL